MRGTTFLKENTPSTNSSARLCTLSSLEGENNFYGHETLLNSDGQKRSQTSRTSPKVNANELPSTNSRSNFERLARMRRLQSKSSLSLRKADESPESVRRLGSQSKAQAVYGLSSGNPWHQGLPSSSSSLDVQMENSRPANSQGMVESFLKGRRREMRISEESGGDPAFL